MRDAHNRAIAPFEVQRAIDLVNTVHGLPLEAELPPVDWKNPEAMAQLLELLEEGDAFNEFRNWSIVNGYYPAQVPYTGTPVGEYLEETGRRQQALWAKVKESPPGTFLKQLKKQSAERRRIEQDRLVEKPAPDPKVYPPQRPLLGPRQTVLCDPNEAERYMRKHGLTHKEYELDRMGEFWVYTLLLDDYENLRRHRAFLRWLLQWGSPSSVGSELPPIHLQFVRLNEGRLQLVSSFAAFDGIERARIGYCACGNFFWRKTLGKKLQVGCSRRCSVRSSSAPRSKRYRAGRTYKANAPQRAKARKRKTMWKQLWKAVEVWVTLREIGHLDEYKRLMQIPPKARKKELENVIRWSR